MCVWWFENVMNCDVFTLWGNRRVHNRTYVAIIKQRIIETLFIASLIIEVASMCKLLYSKTYGFLFITFMYNINIQSRTVITMQWRYHILKYSYGTFCSFFLSIFRSIKSDSNENLWHAISTFRILCVVGWKVSTRSWIFNALGRFDLKISL